MSKNLQPSVPEDRTESFSEPPIVVSFSMILDRGLTEPEKVKFKRLEAQISEIFVSIGVVIRLCEGKADGDLRTISFIPRLIGIPLITFSSEHFLRTPDNDLLIELGSRIAEFTREP
jgi:hypothetical protein